MIDATKADEVMVTTMIYDHARAPALLRIARARRSGSSDRRTK